MITLPKPCQSTHPITINVGFKCKNCGKINKKALKTCRDHCVKCLYSLHVDANIPGDRASKCLGLMQPVSIDYNSKKGLIIVYVCTICGQKKVNKTARDDDAQTIAAIMAKQNATLEPRLICLQNNRCQSKQQPNLQCKNKRKKF